MKNTQQHIAIFGCGQLAQMMAQAGIALGLRFSFIADEGEDSRCVEGLGKIVTYQPEMGAEALFKALDKPHIITVEKEMVNTHLLDELSAFCNVAPNDRSIHIAQNRIREKQFLQDAGIPTAEFVCIESREQLANLPQQMGYPIYVKAAESGYDGYHQWRLRCEEDLQKAALLAAIDARVELIAEKHVAYRREVSVIAARNSAGDVAVYPMMENRHEDGVLIATIAPAPNDEAINHAKAMIQTLMLKLDYVGVLTMECFDTEEGIVVNELAPRVHNSGHWTIEGAQTSQFSQHCRAIADMPLASTEQGGVAGMINMLGRHGDEAVLVQDTDNKVYYHAYGKQERERRKLGHVTVTADTHTALKQSLNRILSGLYAQRYDEL